jgi:serine/threonine protein kinase
MWQQRRRPVNRNSQRRIGGGIAGGSIGGNGQIRSDIEDSGIIANEDENAVRMIRQHLPPSASLSDPLLTDPDNNNNNHIHGMSGNGNNTSHSFLPDSYESDYSDDDLESSPSVDLEWIEADAEAMKRIRCLQLQDRAFEAQQRRLFKRKQSNPNNTNHGAAASSSSFPSSSSPHHMDGRSVDSFTDNYSSSILASPTPPAHSTSRRHLPQGERLLAGGSDLLLSHDVQLLIEENSRRFIDFALLHINDTDCIGRGGSSRVYSGFYRNYPVAIKFFTKTNNATNNNKKNNNNNNNRMNPSTLHTPSDQDNINNHLLVPGSMLSNALDESVMGDNIEDELTPDTISAYAKETAIAASFNHPSIVQFIGICVRPPAIFLVSELCSEGNLFNLLPHLRFHPSWGYQAVLTFCIQATRSVEYLHEGGFVHRDIKSLNYLVTKRGIVKLSDFGLSRMFPNFTNIKSNSGTSGLHTSNGTWAVNSEAPTRRSSMNNDPTPIEQQTPPDKQNINTQQIQHEDGQNGGSTIPPTLLHNHSNNNNHNNHNNINNHNNTTTNNNNNLTPSIPNASDVPLRLIPSVPHGRTTVFPPPPQLNQTHPTGTIKNNPAASSSSALNVLTRRVGSRYWMSPEMLHGDVYTLSSDIYSLTMVFWEILTCQAPFDDIDDSMINDVLMRGDHPIIPTWTPEPFALLLKDGWARDPHRRPSAHILLQRLEHILHQLEEEYNLPPLDPSIFFKKGAREISLANRQKVYNEQQQQLMEYQQQVELLQQQQEQHHQTDEWQQLQHTNLQQSHHHHDHHLPIPPSNHPHQHEYGMVSSPWSYNDGVDTFHQQNYIITNTGVQPIDDSWTINSIG